MLKKYQTLIMIFAFDIFLSRENRIKNGFFIEAGAYDGEIGSNTLLFELKHNWTGLLVEPNPDAFKMLTNKVGILILFFIMKKLV